MQEKIYLKWRFFNFNEGRRNFPVSNCELHIVSSFIRVQMQKDEIKKNFIVENPGKHHSNKEIKIDNSSYNDIDSIYSKYYLMKII